MTRSTPFVCSALILVSAAISPQTSTTMPEIDSNRVQATARGTFDVHVSPLATDDTAEVPFGRVLVRKEIAGDLTGTSTGVMLSSGTPADASAGYVALERVTGTLRGRRGTFVLQHVGHMTRDSMTMTITVLPHSGTDELVGLAGRFTIVIADGKHSYSFEYSLG